MQLRKREREEEDVDKNLCLFCLEILYIKQDTFL